MKTKLRISIIRHFWPYNKNCVVLNLSQNDNGPLILHKVIEIISLLAFWVKSSSPIIVFAKMQICTIFSGVSQQFCLVIFFKTSYVSRSFSIFITKASFWYLYEVQVISMCLRYKNSKSVDFTHLYVQIQMLCEKHWFSNSQFRFHKKCNNLVVRCLATTTLVLNPRFVIYLTISKEISEIR